MSNKIIELRKKGLAKQAILNSQQAVQSGDRAAQMATQAFSKAIQTENNLAQQGRYLAATEVRLQAILSLLCQVEELKILLSPESISIRTLELQVGEFNEKSAQDDEKNQLANADSEVAATGHHAIFSLKLFLDGAEQKDQNILRAKNVLGAGDIIKELDEALVGLKVGESKAFPLTIQKQAYEATITLHGLRSAPPPPPQEAPTEAPTEGTNP